MVPVSFARGTPCSSPATMKLASTGSTAPFIVIDTDILSSGTPSKRIFMSSTRVDRDAGLADVADDARVVGVVAAVGGEVEGDREAHLPRGEVRAVERVRLLGGREAGVLADRPRPVRVHRRARAAQEREHARQRVDLERPSRSAAV